MLSAAPVSRKKRILVVDDDEATRTGLARLFWPEYDVVQAEDGAHALELVGSDGGIDLVVSDVWMPRLDGIEMMHRLRQRAAMRHVPVIFLTGQTAFESVVAGIDAGARHYLTKPVDPAVLVDKVRRILRA